MYQYILGEKKPVQLQWSRRDGKDFNITKAIYSYADIIEQSMSINGKVTLVNLEPTETDTGTKYCTVKAELTPIDPLQPVETHIAEIPIVVIKPRG